MQQEFSSLLLTGVILIIIYYAYKNSKYYTLDNMGSMKFPDLSGPIILYVFVFLYLFSYWIINNFNKYYENKPLNLEPTTQRFIDSLKGTKLTLDYLATPNTSETNVDIQDIIIPNDISVRIIRPKNNNSKLPVVMYFHGGGWVAGNKNTHDRLIKQISLGANVAVIFVNYTPAPEAKFPTQINQALMATLYVSQNGNKLNIDSNNLIIMGDSVGGNMAIAVCLLSKQKNIKIKYLILAYPVTSSLMNTKSYQEFENGPWLTKKGIETHFNAYLEKNTDRNNILISPVEGPINSFVNFPNTLVITDENDILKDEGETFAHKLMNANVKVTSVRYLGICHDFLILDALKDTSPVKNAIDLIIMEINKHKN